MKRVEEQLLEYRRTRKAALQQQRVHGDGNSDMPMSLNGKERRRTAQQPPAAAAETANDALNLRRSNALFDCLAAFDLLDIYPMRKWRQFCAYKPLQCWTLTASLWLSGQLLAAHVQFGFVYFVLSALLLLLLNLGVRREGELSAYSVFNPNCERLPGQLTGEHFERDMLFARRQ
ncbi:hypothetical protein niasHT_031588 [Heterodera trifolii]|uniref:SAYSvFN domain-containing protein n=1 Tax=Heterodera trifolii TaxID=157864 RepID=A0ABD2IYE1_9BILA